MGRSPERGSRADRRPIGRSGTLRERLQAGIEGRSGTDAWHTGAHIATWRGSGAARRPAAGRHQGPCRSLRAALMAAPASEIGTRIATADTVAGVGGHRLDAVGARDPRSRAHRSGGGAYPSEHLPWRERCAGRGTEPRAAKGTDQPCAVAARVLTNPGGWSGAQAFWRATPTAPAAGTRGRPCGGTESARNGARFEGRSAARGQRLYLPRCGLSAVGPSGEPTSARRGAAPVHREIESTVCSVSRTSTWSPSATDNRYRFTAACCAASAASDCQIVTYSRSTIPASSAA